MGFDPHPDANLLGAYLEGGLDDRRRRDLLRHLSACDQCRRVAACANTLGLPSTPAVTAAAWTWRAPVALAAGAVLMAGLAWMRAPRAWFAAAGVPAKVAQVHRLSPAVPSRPLRHPRRRASAAVPLRTPAAWDLPTAALPPLPSMSMPAQPAPVQHTMVQPALAFAPLTTGFRDQAPAESARAELAAWGGATPSLPLTAADGPVALPTTSLTSTESAWPFTESYAGGTATPSTPDGPFAPDIAADLDWAISRGGQVLRSVGAGLWAAVPLVPGVHFRVLASIGASVWAGGRADQLFFSSDRGAHWRQVHLPGLGAKAAPLSSIAFRDPQHGFVSSSDGHTWSTADGGATWTKQ